MLGVSVVTCFAVLATSVSIVAAQEEAPEIVPEDAPELDFPEFPDLSDDTEDVLFDIPAEDLEALQALEDVDIPTEQTLSLIHI